jgi:hypothetical protein
MQCLRLSDILFKTNKNLKMNIPTFLLLIAIAFIAMAFFYATPQKKSLYTPLEQQARPYVSKNPLTPTETMFYHQLVEALPDFIVLAQAQLSSFLKVDTSKTEWKDYNRWFNPIAQQSVDYLICQKDFSIIAAVELDDKSHNGVKSIKRDTKKNENLHAANVPLIRWHAEAMPETETIRQVVFNHAYEPTITMPTQPAWLADGPGPFARQPQTPVANIAKNITIWLAIAMVLMAIFNLSKGNVTSQTTRQINNFEPSNLQQNQTPPVNPAQEFLLRQQQERAAQETSRIRAIQAQQLINQQQAQQKLVQAQEAALKEDAWNHYYKKTVECTNVDDMVKCGNTYIRNRQQFEYEWEHQRSKFR